MSWTRGRPARTRAQREQAARIRRRDPVCRCGGCPECGDTCTRSTTQADHIVNYVECLRRGINPDTDDNMQGLCTPCHDHKTYLEQRAGAARINPRRPQRRHPSDP